MFTTFDPNHSPSLPNPVITSSKISSIPYFKHTSLTLGQYSLGGTTPPNGGETGSPIKHDIDSGP